LITVCRHSRLRPDTKVGSENTGITPSVISRYASVPLPRVHPLHPGTDKCIKAGPKWPEFGQGMPWHATYTEANVVLGRRALVGHEGTFV
jgi:hypothetical protein